MTTISACPVCQREDAVRCRDEARFYQEGQLTAICFHGHDGLGPVVFVAETGETLRSIALPPHQALYRAAEADDGARGFGAAFLAEHCGVFTLSRQAIVQVNPPLPTEKDWLRAESQEGVLTVAPFWKGAELCGLEVRIVERKSIGRVSKWTRILGEAGVYIANPRVQPEAVVLFEGTWDAVTAAWDALEAGEPHRYAFLSVASGTRPEVVEETLKIHFPGIPFLILTDQDGAGKGARRKYAHLGTLACLRGCGAVKDYRDAEPKARRAALLEAIERALAEPEPSGEHGLQKIAHRALDGALRGKQAGLRDLEAWRFGQRCAGICRCYSGSKRLFAIRARIERGLPAAEGQFEFDAILDHRAMKQIRIDYPDLAAVINGGATETPHSPQWMPPQFVEDGRHWTEIPEEQRTPFARVRGWEPWLGKDPGAPLSTDLPALLDQLQGAYAMVRIPGVPDSEVYLRVFAFCTAMALSSLWAEERWLQKAPIGFLPWVWFYGGDTTGKGTAAKIIALLVSGTSRTYGSQRFDGAQSGWLTESVCYLPICFRDELDEFLNHSDLEDLKTNLAGDPLQVRKKFEAGITIAPKPVVFSTNNLKINEDDEATKSRVTVVNLTANPLSTRERRSAAFDTFYRWVEDGGSDLTYRVGIALYREFRSVPIGKARWSRSAVFDAAMAFVCGKLHIDPSVVVADANSAKDACIREGLPWFHALQDYVNHEMAGVVGYHDVRLVEALGIDSSSEAQARKLRRWFGQIEAAVATGPLRVCGWEVRLGPSAPTTSRTIRLASPSTPDMSGGQTGCPDASCTREEEEFHSSLFTDNGF